MISTINYYLWFFLLFIYILIIIKQIKKKDYKSWDERLNNNEMYTFLDYIKKDLKREKIKKIISIYLISKIIKKITKIQIMISCILFIPVLLGKKSKQNNNIFEKIFIEIPCAYCELIILKKKKKINREEIKNLAINLTFSRIYGRSRWNISITLELNKIIENIIEKDPMWKKNKKKSMILASEIVMKEKFNTVIKIVEESRK